MIWAQQANAKKDQIKHVHNQIKIQKIVQSVMRNRDFSI